jgi:hypothetical protein
MADIMRFALEIKLGNDAMQDGTDIADALERVAGKIRDEGPFESPMIVDTVLSSGIMDANGARVGQWAVQSLAPEQAEQRTAFTAGSQ